MQYLNCNKDLLRTFIEAGMPAAKLCGRWYAHIDNIDKFFQIVTRQQAELKQRFELSDYDLHENGSGIVHNRKTKE